MPGTGQITDEERRFYEAALASAITRNRTDLKLRYFKLLLGVTTGQITDLERRYYSETLGIRQITDGRKRFLESQGYDSQISDDNRDYWEDN